MLIETKQRNARGLTDTLRRAIEKKGKTATAGLLITLSLLGVFRYAEAFSLAGMLAPFTGETSIFSPGQSGKAPALRAAVNSDPNPSKGGGDITVVGGVALLSEIGPQGTLAEIQDVKPSSDQISIYVVREGDSLSQIAEMFGVSTNTILWANNLRSASAIRPGDTLVILPVTGIEHTVQKGETLASIVKKYRGEMQDVLEFNHLAEGAKLVAGDTIVIPDGVDAPAPKPASSGSKASVRAASGPTIVGYYLRPIVGGIKTQGIHGYNGVDIAVPQGSPVMAACPGSVLVSRDSGWNSGYGNYVVIQCSNGTQTVYGHLSATSVAVGSTVSRGDLIGLSGNTGRSTGAHLHFEIRGATNPF